jgi:hypothetical protein
MTLSISNSLFAAIKALTHLVWEDFVSTRAPLSTDNINADHQGFEYGPDFGSGPSWWRNQETCLWPV